MIDAPASLSRSTDSMTPSRTTSDRSVLSRKYASGTPTRTSEIPCEIWEAYGGTLRSTLDGSVESKPAIASSRSAQSYALLAIGPTESSEYARGTTPDLGTRPYVTFRPVMPVAAAGSRTEPPVSVPTPPKAWPAATAIAVPELDPEAEWSRFHGLRGIGKDLVMSGSPKANSLVVDLP